MYRAQCRCASNQFVLRLHEQHCRKAFQSADPEKEKIKANKTLAVSKRNIIGTVKQ